MLSSIPISANRIDDQDLIVIRETTSDLLASLSGLRQELKLKNFDLASEFADEVTDAALRIHHFLRMGGRFRVEVEAAE